MPVRGGLALTGNAPNRPASTLPAPAPRKSRSTSAGLSGSDGNERVVAAVCTITTMAIRKRERHQPRPLLRSDDPATTASAASPARCRPRRRPCFRDRPQITAIVAATSPISAPGILALIASDTGDHGQHAEADAERVEVGVAEMPRQLAMRSSIGPLGAGSPSTPGNCDTRMCTEMPARKPTVTGVDSRLAIQPRRNRPPTIRITPTISASATASA